MTGTGWIAIILPHCSATAVATGRTRRAGLSGIKLNAGLFNSRSGVELDPGVVGADCRQHRGETLRRKRGEAPVLTMRLAGRCRSAHDVQVPAGFKGR